MKLFRSRFLRIVVLAAFFGFHAVQTFHTHRAGASDGPCSVCQIIHHTPGLDVPASSQLHAEFTFQEFLRVGDRIVVADRDTNTALPRAPPAC